MAFDQLDALELRIVDIVKLVHELKRHNASLEEGLKAAHQQIATEEDLARRRESERLDIESRIEKVIGDIELLEYEETPDQVMI